MLLKTRSIITLTLIFALTFTLSTSQTSSNITKIQSGNVVTNYYYDLQDNPGAEFVSDVYNASNTITFNAAGMNITALENTYAHIQRQFNDTTVIQVETSISLTSGSPGASWSPGMGIWWDAENNIHFNFDNGTFRLVSKENNVTRSSRLEVGAMIYNLVLLRLRFNETGNVYPEYNYDNGIWHPYWDGNTTNEIGDNTPNFVVSNSIDSSADPMIMLGKGFSSGLLDDFPDTLAGDDEFNTYYIPSHGVFGSIQFHYLSMDLGIEMSVTTPTPDATSSTTSGTNSKTSSEPISSSNSETSRPGDTNSISETTTPSVPLPISSLVVISSLIFLVTVRTIKKR